jgi:hypothetical protein
VAGVPETLVARAQRAAVPVASRMLHTAAKNSALGHSPSVKGSSATMMRIVHAHRLHQSHLRTTAFRNIVSATEATSIGLQPAAVTIRHRTDTCPASVRIIAKQATTTHPRAAAVVASQRRITPRKRVTCVTISSTWFQMAINVGRSGLSRMIRQ